MIVREYQAEDGGRPFSTWLDRLRDGRARGRIVARIDRMKAGLFGDWRPVGGGVRELRIDYGPGYRVYYGEVGKKLIMLLRGGDKRTQASDIRRANGYWKDYKSRERALPGGRAP